MTLTEAKMLLEKHRIPFEIVQYENEAAYWHHTTPFPYTKNARPCQVIALVIPSVNGVKHIELQFNQSRREFLFEELRFGGYSFEMFDHAPETLEMDLMDYIFQIADGKLAVIEYNDLKHKRWRGDACFFMDDADDVFGAPGFREAVERIDAKKSLWNRLRGAQMQYDIYDWHTHRRIVK